ncbi:MAG: glycosyltransferase family 39 protein [Patescibacteria group bacterium]|nr:glycosyltransferase family 39 protein [Patescibacteria group bacterium]
MSNFQKFRSFLSARADILCLGCIILFVVLLSGATLLTKPRIWIDEAVTVELARNFAQYGILSIQTAPHVFFGQSYLLQSTGYPLTVVLAAVFRIFGYRFAAERVTMLLIMVAALSTVFWFARKIFGRKEALLSALLIATFATFYASGRTAVGEVLGFIFLLSCLYCWLSLQSYYWAGFFLGLAVVTKPSVFLLALPAVIIVLAYRRRGFFLNTVRLGVGMIPAALGWIVLVLGNPFVKNVWVRLLGFYRNPYGAASSAGNIAANLSGFFHSPTLMYFGILFALACAGWFAAERGNRTDLLGFVLVYSVIAFLYYLRSPGWLRYVFIAELLILFVTPFVFSELYAVFGRFTGTSLFSGYGIVVVTLIVMSGVQLTHLFTGAQIYDSDAALQTAAYINTAFPGKSVGVINALGLSVLLRTDARYQTVDLVGLPPIGDGVLSHADRPDVVVFSDTLPTNDEMPVLSSFYHEDSVRNGYAIYAKNG